MVSSTEDQSKTKVLIDKPLNWPDAGFNQSVKAIRFTTDEDHNLWGQPVLLAGINPSETEIRVNSIGKANVDYVGQEQIGILVRSVVYLYSPDSTDFQRLRTPDTLKLVHGQTDTIVVWNPAAGKRVRVMGYVITLSKEAACAGLFRFDIYGTTVPVGVHQVSAAALVATGQVEVFAVNFPGNGILLAVDEDLTIGCSAALTAGMFSAMVYGTEE